MEHPLEPEDFERPEVLRAQRREWMAERIGWTIMALILGAGVLGLLGEGVLAHRSIHSRHLTLQYDRVVRSNAPARLQLEISETFTADPVRVWLQQNYMAAVQLQHIVPQPLQSFSDSGRLVMDFVAPPGGGHYTIMVEIQPNRIGNHHAALGFGADSIRFQQFVLP